LGQVSASILQPDIDVVSVRVEYAGRIFNESVQVIERTGLQAHTDLTPITKMHAQPGMPSGGIGFTNHVAVNAENSEDRRCSCRSLLLIE
jgi:hypothetical protein